MIELYRPSECPYCAKVADKLDELGLVHEQHNVMPFRFLRREIKEVSGQSGVPVLVDPEHDISGMAESDDIADYNWNMCGSSISVVTRYSITRSHFETGLPASASHLSPVRDCPGLSETSPVYDHCAENDVRAE